jgi:V8-like Glu-specific endopeptidase
VAVRVGGALCTGTLITPTWVLTAGHCVDPEVIDIPTQAQLTASVRVHFNTVDLGESDGLVVKAVATIKDPLFDESRLGTNDIGLIQLERAITEVAPSPINLDAALAPVGTMVTFVGYGTTGSGRQAAGVQFALNSRTSVSCSTLGIGADANLLCFSQADNKGTCTGDSGGPSFAVIDGKATVVGVTSFGDETCAMFGAETRVDAEQAFLLAHVPELVGCTSDAGCPGDRMCFASRCIAAPFSATGVGAVCSGPADCESSQCAEKSNDKRCSLTCSVSNAASCPDGFECLDAGNNVGACWPTDSGGCCDAGGAGGPQAIGLGLAVAGLALRRKRR